MNVTHDTRTVRTIDRFTVIDGATVDLGYRAPKMGRIVGVVVTDWDPPSTFARGPRVAVVVQPLRKDGTDSYLGTVEVTQYGRAWNQSEILNAGNAALRELGREVMP
jgi:hypothetical protein